MGTGIIYGRMNTDYARNGCFLTRDEVNAILLVCKNYKLHFSRKCAERPFENVISIISKIPWHIPKIINTLHRDHIFELDFIIKLRLSRILIATFSLLYLCIPFLTVAKLPLFYK